MNLLPKTFLKVLIVASFLSCLMAQGQVTVSGSGTVYGEPDVAMVELGVNISNEDLSVALKESNNITAELINALEFIGVDSQDIRTAYFNVWTEEPYEQRPTRQYRVNNSLSVTLRDINQLGDVLGQAVELGANNISNIQFAMSDTEGLEAQARELAMVNARAKAEQLADLAGVELGDVVMVSDATVNVASFDAPMAARSTMMADSAVPVAGGQLSVSASVQVRFEIKSVESEAN